MRCNYLTCRWSYFDGLSNRDIDDWVGYCRWLISNSCNGIRIATRNAHSGLYPSAYAGSLPTGTGAEALQPANRGCDGTGTGITHTRSAGFSTGSATSATFTYVFYQRPRAAATFGTAKVPMGSDDITITVPALTCV